MVSFGGVRMGRVFRASEEFGDGRSLVGRVFGGLVVRGVV